MPRPRDRQSCPVTAAVHRLGDKCSPVIRLLAVRGYGFNDLDRSIERSGGCTTLPAAAG